MLINELPSEMLAAGIAADDLLVVRDVSAVALNDYTKKMRFDQLVTAVGAGYQPLDADLTSIAALTTTVFGRGFLTDADAAASRTRLELGSAALLTAAAAGGAATLDGSGKVPLAQLPDSIVGQVEYQGTWNASTNTPALTSPTNSTTKGHYYIVTVAGTQFGNDYGVGDWAISDGATWGKVDNSDSVTTVFGRLGNVVAASGDYTATQITFTPFGGLAAVNVQSALQELDTEKLAKASNLSDLASVSTARTNLGLGNVENAALSTWAGSANLTTVGALNSGSITSGFGSIDIGADSLTAGAISGTTGTFSGLIYATGSNIRLANAFNLTGNDTGGAQQHLISFTAANKVSIDAGGYGTILGGSLTAGAISGTTGTFSGTAVSTGTYIGLSDPTYLIGNANGIGATFRQLAATQAYGVDFRRWTGSALNHSVGYIGQIVGIGGTFNLGVLLDLNKSSNTQATSQIGFWDADGYNGVIGATTLAAGSFTTLSANGILSLLDSGVERGRIQTSSAVSGWEDALVLQANTDDIIFATAFGSGEVGRFTSTGLTVVGDTTTSSGYYSNITSGVAYRATNGTTGALYTQFTNTGGSAIFGQENSSGNNLIIGASAYDTIIRGPSGLAFSANAGSGMQMRLSSTGLSVVGTLATTSHVNLAAGNNFNIRASISDGASSDAPAYFQSGEPGVSANNVILSNNYYGINGGSSGQRNSSLGASYIRLNAGTTVNSATTLGFISAAGVRNDVLLVNSVGAQITGTLAATGNTTLSSTSGAPLLVINDGSAIGGNGRQIRFTNTGAGTKYNWLIGAQVNVNDVFEITPSTAVGGSTYSTPVIQVSTSGLSVSGTGSYTGNVTLTGANGTLTFGGTGYGAISAPNGDLYLNCKVGNSTYAGPGNQLAVNGSGASVTGTVSTTVRFQSTTSAGSTAWGSTGAELMANTVYGAIVAGYGTTADVSLVNRAGNPALEVVANTQNVICRGALGASGNVWSGNNAFEISSGTTDGWYVKPAGQMVMSANGDASAIMRRRSSDGTMQSFYRDTTSVGSISVTTTATAYNTSSDARLKTNVRPLTNSGAIIDALKPSLFDWKSGQKDSYGFIAQEAYAVFPQAVTKGDDDPENITAQWAMDASRFMPLAIAEIKSLRARVAALENA